MAAPQNVRLIASRAQVATFDYHEATLSVDQPDAANPFTDVVVQAQLTTPSGRNMSLEGFCDDEAGATFRVRFLALEPGLHEYRVTYRQGAFRREFRGRFSATRSGRKGLVRVDQSFPFHFVWSGTGEHYFYNGTTAYWLLGYRDDGVIREAIDRLSQHKINRIRIALSARTKDGGRWKEDQVKPSRDFQFRIEPWPAARPEDIENPGYDVTRFKLETFRKCEALLRHAREKEMVVSLIFRLDAQDPGVDPFGLNAQGNEGEERYYRYAVARMAAFSNVMWDVTNEWHLSRSEAWVEHFGRLIKRYDPWQHVTSVHGRGTFPFRTSPWADFAMFQSWDEHGSYDFMLKNRREQLATGQAKPQVNEEYGYEDHYPFPWGEGRKFPARIADNRRRLAWEMTMAGGYQTTGERANVPGMGGWITGRGNDEMILPVLHGHMVDFFTSTRWWTADPRPELIQGGGLLLADPGRLYIVYQHKAGQAVVTIAPGNYEVRQFNPRTGEWKSLPAASGVAWSAPAATDNEDWAYILVSNSSPRK